MRDKRAYTLVVETVLEIEADTLEIAEEAARDWGAGGLERTSFGSIVRGERFISYRLTPKASGVRDGPKNSTAEVAKTTRNVSSVSQNQ